MGSTTSTSEETGAITEADAATAIEALLGDDGDEPPKRTKTRVAAPDPDDDDDEDDAGDLGEQDLEDEDGDEDADGDEDDESDEPDEDEQDEQDEDEDEDAPTEFDDEALITVPVDGKTEKLTLGELKKGYSRTAVFTKRTQEAAALRKEAEALSTQLQQERAQLMQIAAALEARMTSEEPEPDWAKLKAEDPVEWAIKRQEFAEKLSEREQLKQVERELSQRNAQAQQAALSETIKSERTKLLEKIPEWADEKKAAKDMADLRSYMIEQGFSEEETAQIYDHRAVVVLRKAMRLDKMVARQKALEKSGKPAKIIQKTLVPGRGRTKTSRAANAGKAMDQLRKTGSSQDAQRALMAIPGLI